MKLSEYTDNDRHWYNARWQHPAVERAARFAMLGTTHFIQCFLLYNLYTIL